MQHFSELKKSELRNCFYQNDEKVMLDGNCCEKIFLSTDENFVRVYLIEIDHVILANINPLY